MAIDLEALRRKHEQLNGGGSTSNNSDFLNKFYQIPEGSNAVRILPGKDDDHEFYAETKIHRVTGPDGTSKNYHCRKVHGEPCPLCDTPLKGVRLGGRATVYCSKCQRAQGFRK